MSAPVGRFDSPAKGVDTTITASNTTPKGKPANQGNNGILGFFGSIVLAGGSHVMAGLRDYVGIPLVKVFMRLTLTNIITEQQIIEKKAALIAKYGTVYSEFAHTLTEFLLTYLNHYVVNINEIAPSIRPKWVVDLGVSSSLQEIQLQDDNFFEQIEKQADPKVRFAAIGQLFEYLIKNYPNEAGYIVEFNVLSILERVLDRVTVLENNSENPHALLDIMLELFKKLADEYRDYNATNTLPSDIDREDTSLAEGKLQLGIDGWSLKLLKIVLPSHNDIFLPNILDRDILKRNIYDVVKTTAFPQMFKEIIETVHEAKTRDKVVVSMLKEIEDAISGKNDIEDAESTKAKKPYSKTKEFTYIFQNFFREVTNYYSKNTFKGMFRGYFQNKIAQKVSIVLMNVMSAKSLKTYMQKGIMEAALAIAPKGHWEKNKETGLYTFERAPFVFPKTVDDKDLLEKQKVEETEKIKHKMKTLLERVGSDISGVEDGIQKTLFLIDSKIVKKIQSDTTSSGLWNIVQKLQMVWYIFTRIIVSFIVHILNIPSRIKQKVNAIIPKVRNELNNRLVYDACEVILTKLGSV